MPHADWLSEGQVGSSSHCPGNVESLHRLWNEWIPFQRPGRPGHPTVGVRAGVVGPSHAFYPLAELSLARRDGCLDRCQPAEAWMAVDGRLYPSLQARQQYEVPDHRERTTHNHNPGPSSVRLSALPAPAHVLCTPYSVQALCALCAVAQLPKD